MIVQGRLLVPLRPLLEHLDPRLRVTPDFNPDGTVKGVFVEWPELQTP
jgi:hypothetical protein